jgi:hypothetical protein
MSITELEILRAFYEEMYGYAPLYLDPNDHNREEFTEEFPEC